MSVDTRLHFIPYDEDPLTRLAAWLLDRYRQQLPDLAAHVILFPTAGASQRFRQVLLSVARQHGWDALIPPYSGTLSSWLQRFADPSIPVLSATARELLLLDALADYPALKNRYGTWPLVDTLLSLFDELTLNQAALPVGLAEFQHQLAAGYGVDTDLQPLTEEAKLVHLLWTAWQSRLMESGCQDLPHSQLQALARSIDGLAPETHIYLTGFIRFRQAELVWLQKLIALDKVELLLHGQPGVDGNHPAGPLTELCTALGGTPVPSPSSDPYSAFLERVFTVSGQDLKTRAAEQAQATATSPVMNRLTICEALNPEQEARAIDLQVRRWRLQGLQNIGIVTNDRKLARRARALLERANIHLRDTAGWTLSTTSAASAVMRWLDCIEQDFHYIPLLDLLKSPFVDAGDSTATVVGQFEEGLVLGDGIAGHLPRYRQALQRREKKLDDRYSAGTSENIDALLHKLATAVEPLQTLLSGGDQKAKLFFDALISSLGHLGMRATLMADEAGVEVLDEIEQLSKNLSRGQPRIGWHEFRAWLRRNLERRKFKPPMRGSDVELMGFSDSRLYRFDGLIIAGVHREHLPGAVDDSPFFNEGVRRQLGLPSRLQHQQTLYYDFRRLLEAAPNILMTLHGEEQDKPVMPSPWLERLQALHTLAYGRRLQATELLQLLAIPDTEIILDHTPVPPAEGVPAVITPVELLPKEISATAYQRLLDCSYQFYTAHCLGLTPVEELHETMEKNDYGNRIHRILQAFHGGIEGLPGPFDKTLSAATRTEAEAQLHKISDVVFTADVGRSLLARGWLYRWQRLIPLYVAWQMGRTKRWKIGKTEILLHNTFPDTDRPGLYGRLDRLDKGPEGCSVIDYKTGAVPSIDTVEAGENIQLLFYALLPEEPVEEVVALALNDDNVKPKVRLEGEALQQLAKKNGERLVQIYQSIEKGAHLPAWGDAYICQHCPMGGLCRKDFWEDDENAA